MTRFDQSVARQPRLGEGSMKLRLRSRKASHCHHSPNTNAGKQCQALRLRQQFGESEAALGILSGQIQLDQSVHSPSPRNSEFTYRVRKPGAVERVQQYELLQRLDLVPLKMPDQMPAHRNIDRGDLLQCFLNFVFADVVQARFISRT